MMNTLIGVLIGGWIISLALLLVALLEIWARRADERARRRMEEDDDDWEWQ